MSNFKLPTKLKVLCFWMFKFFLGLPKHLSPKIWLFGAKDLVEKKIPNVFFKNGQPINFKVDMQLETHLGIHKLKWNWQFGDVVNISNGVENMWPCKNVFSHLSSIIIFCNPTHKIEIGTINRQGTTNSKPLGQSLWWANQKHWITVKSYLLHYFLCLLLPTINYAILLSQKHFHNPN
jgi:hypothetical protein